MAVMITMVVDVLVAGIIMMMMVVVAMVVDVLVAGIMMMMVVVVAVAVVVDVIVAGGMRRVIGVDVIARSDDVDRRSHRKGGKNESNKNFKLHICLEY